MSISDRKQRDRNERKSIILKAAIELFLNEGFEHVTIRGIAEKIEYSPATIYLYFKDKTDILMALHHEGFNILVKYLRNVTDDNDDALLQMRKRAIAYTNFAIENPEYYNLIFIISFRQKGLSSPDEWDEGRIAYNLLRESVAKCLESELIVSGDLEITSFAIWSFLHGIASLIVGQNGGPVKIEDQKPFVAKTINFFYDNLK
jgi:AcrR family transcriptional regulator